jgi:hypothetical protein
LTEQAAAAATAHVPSSDLTAQGSSKQDLAVADSDKLEVSAVIPLPYEHYRLVGEDGRQIERPDKHPFALSRVLYDSRWGAPDTHAVVCYARGAGGGACFKRVKLKAAKCMTMLANPTHKRMA